MIKIDVFLAWAMIVWCVPEKPVRQLKKKKDNLFDTHAETEQNNAVIDDPSREGVLKMNTTPCASLS